MYKAITGIVPVGTFLVGTALIGTALFGTTLFGTTLVGFSLVVAPSPYTQDQESSSELKWPPEGPAWETSPERAFSIARETGKPVMAFVATAG